jgi:hypothetical protein
LRKTEWKWTPQQIARMPIPQMLALFRDGFDPPPGAQALAMVNRIRQKKGLPVITSRNTKG